MQWRSAQWGLLKQHGTQNNKYSHLHSAEKESRTGLKLYVNNDRMFSFGWTIPLKPKSWLLVLFLLREMEAFGHSYNYVGKLFIPSWRVAAQSSMENPFYILSSWVLLLLFHFHPITYCSELNQAPKWANKISPCRHKCSSNDPQTSRKWIRTLWEAADPFPIKALP